MGKENINPSIFQAECISLSRQLCSGNKLPLTFDHALKGLMGERSLVNTVAAKILISSMKRAPLMLIMMRKPYYKPEPENIPHNLVKITPGGIYALAFMSPTPIPDNIFWASTNSAKASITGIHARAPQGKRYSMLKQTFVHAVAFAGSNQPSQLICYDIFKKPHLNSQEVPENWNQVNNLIEHFEKTWNL